MNYCALSLASLLSITFHGAVFLTLKQNYQSALPSSAIYRPIAGMTISYKSAQQQQASVSSAASAEITKNSLDAVKVKGYFPASSLNESVKESQHANVDSDGKFTGEALTDLNATPKSGWSLDTQSLSAAQVVTMVLQLTIDKNGDLDDYFVIESTASKEQTQDILKNFRLTSFVPSVRGGKPISHTMIVEIKVDNLDLFADQKTE